MQPPASSLLLPSPRTSNSALLVEGEDRWTCGGNGGYVVGAGEGVLWWIMVITWLVRGREIRSRYWRLCNRCG